MMPSVESTRVLLVEDNPGDARLLREALPGEFRITHVERMEDAIGALASGETDVVLLDLSLPDSHGLETCRRIRVAAPDVPVLVLTGTNDADAAVQAVREGAQDWLLKGVDAEVVVRSIRYAVERNRLMVRLRELDRVRSLFLSIVSHDLINPTASILSGLHLLLSGAVGEITLKQRKILELVDRTAHRQARLIHDLLDVAVIEAGEMTFHAVEVRIDSLFASVVDEIGAVVIERGLSVRCEVPPELMFRADPDRLVQALANMVGNALKFATAEIVLRAVAGPSTVTLAVEDDGPGIAPELVDHLFERFVRTDEPRGGAGLGLSIARGIIGAHGGSLRAENRTQGGARFVVVLPR